MDNGARNCALLLRQRPGLAPRCRLIPTDGKDGLTVFDIARFFRSQFQPDIGVLLWITERGPYSGREEPYLFDSYLSGNNVEPRECIWFGSEDADALVATLSLSILFRWDFLLIDRAAKFVAEHSHDNGLNILQASEETLNSLSVLGFGN